MARKRRTKAEILAAKSEGLGDTVEKVLEVTGVAKVAKWLLGEDCGCDERKAKLNELFPYKKPLCLEENEFSYLNEWFNKNTDRVTPIEQVELFKIHSRVFQVRNELTSCPSCVLERINDLSKVYNQYKDEQNADSNS
jgi:hypothetical protein